MCYIWTRCFYIFIFSLTVIYQPSALLSLLAQRQIMVDPCLYLVILNTTKPDYISPTLNRVAEIWLFHHICLFSQKCWHFKSEAVAHTCETMLCRIQKNTSSQPSSLRSSLFPSLYSFIPSYLLEMERYIPSKPFWSFPLSSQVPLISNGKSCLIFQTSRWPFQRKNKVLKMQVLSSNKRQLGRSPVPLHRSHWGACATKKFKVVPPMPRNLKEVHLCQLPLALCQPEFHPWVSPRVNSCTVGLLGWHESGNCTTLLALLLISTTPT